MSNTTASAPLIKVRRVPLTLLSRNTVKDSCLSTNQMFSGHSSGKKKKKKVTLENIRHPHLPILLYVKHIDGRV